MNQFYITVTNERGAFDLATQQFVPHNFRMYVDLKAGTCDGQMILIKALNADYELTQSVLEQMIREPSGKRSYLLWERK